MDEKRERSYSNIIIIMIVYSTSLQHKLNYKAADLQFTLGSGLRSSLHCCVVSIDNKKCVSSSKCIIINGYQRHTATVNLNLALAG